MPLEDWKLREFRRILRLGLLPQWTDAQLQALGRALATADPALIQHYTTRPTYREEAHNGAQCAQAACLVAFPGWKCGLDTIGELDRYFGVVTHRMMALTGPRDVEFFFQVFDGADRAELWPVLLDEVRQERKRRAAEAVPETIRVLIADR